MKANYKYKNNRLYFNEIDLSALIKRNGTPFYLYSGNLIKANINRLRDSLKGEFSIHYAMKANSNLDLLRFMRDQKLGVDVVSGGEMKRALKAGFKPNQIIFSGVGKSVEELSFAIQKKIFSINIESLQETERITTLANRFKKVTSVNLRINPIVDARTHPYITTGFKDNKFGVHESALPRFLEILKTSKYVKFVGLDFHIGSQLTSLRPMNEALKKTYKIFESLRADNRFLKTIDVGGGLGIQYGNEKVIACEDYGKWLTHFFKNKDVSVICEPGRYLVGNAGVLITKIEYVKKAKQKNFLVVNTGMHHFLRPALYEAYHEVLPVKKSSGPKLKFDVVGPICESSDWIAKNRLFHEPKMDEALAICDAGAYGFVMSSDYNLNPKPQEFFLRNN